MAFFVLIDISLEMNGLDMNLKKLALLIYKKNLALIQPFGLEKNSKVSIDIAAISILMRHG